MTPEEALERAREAGIVRLRIPTPFAVGRVNCYLLEDEPLTLVDTGPNSGKSLDELQHQLEDAGHAIEDIELVVITHQHLDHLGLVGILANRSGAEVVTLDVLAQRALELVERLARVGPGVDQRQRVVLDQVAVDPADRERRRDAKQMDARLTRALERGLG